MQSAASWRSQPVYLPRRLPVCLPTPPACLMAIVEGMFACLVMLCARRQSPPSFTTNHRDSFSSPSGAACIIYT
eukprot:gene11851-biopygen221